MSGRHRWAAVALAALLLPAIATACGARAGATSPGDHELTVDLDIHYSRFEPTSITVRAGTLVTFVVHNHDPIRHELIVGPPDVQARHEGGHEATHPPVPGEVTIEPGTTAVTTYHFHTLGDTEYACHLPGHYQYGMHGVVHVLPA